jgi:SPP1 family phage portal protein
VPFFLETETARINRLIEEGAGRGLTERQFFAREITAWKHSPARLEQLQGVAYYNGRQEILHRKRTAIGQDGKLEEVPNLPNNKVIDNQYAKMVDQKCNYLLGKPVTITCENELYSKQLKKRFHKGFQRLLKYVGEDCLTGGKCWLFVHYDERGELCFRRFPAYEILPFWADDDHTKLDAAARLYLQEVWDGYSKKMVERVEIFTPDGISRYVLEGAELLPDVELGDHTPYFTVNTGTQVEGYNWDRLPLVCFKYNKEETPLLRRVKSLQDGINKILSDFENNMEENTRNTILVLRDYEGENLGEFRHNLSTYASVKVRGEGGVDTLRIEVDAENYKAILELFKKALIENARGYDAKDDRMSGSPNQMNIQSMYSDIDLDANGMETEFQAAFHDLLWFICQDLKTKGQGDFTAEDVNITFNRDILINESEAISNCAASAGILSNETIVEQHPWTTDVETELKRLQTEREAAVMDEYAGAFGGGQGGGK